MIQLDLTLMVRTMEEKKYDIKEADFEGAQCSFMCCAVFPQAVTCSDIFCCFYGVARSFFLKVNIEFSFDLRAFENLILMSLYRLQCSRESCCFFHLVLLAELTQSVFFGLPGLSTSLNSQTVVALVFVFLSFWSLTVPRYSATWYCLLSAK